MTITISRADIDRLKEKVTLSDVVGRSVKLFQRGTWKVGLCPFHEETTPSFAVNDAAGHYHCFGCDAHGDLYDWIAHEENLDIKEDWLKVFRLAQDISGDHSVSTAQEVYDPSEKMRTIAQIDEQKRLKAWRIWLKGRSITGTKAETYLRDCRGIRTVDFSGMPMRFIDNHDRWHFCDEIKKPVLLGQWPCLLTAIQEIEQDARGAHRFLALHRTWFDLDKLQGKAEIIYTSPSGKSSKVARKKVDGKYWGRGAMLLTPPGKEMSTCEGLETGLTALELGPVKAVWPAVAMNHMGDMPLPPDCQILNMITDSDSKSERAARNHQKKIQAMLKKQRNNHGVLVQHRPSPPGMDLNDWHLDQLLRHALATGQ